MKLLTLLLNLFIILAWITTSFATVNSGVSFLLSKQGESGIIGGTAVTGWAVMSLAAYGQQNEQALVALAQEQRQLASQSATDVERQILALVSVGEDPRQFVGVDAIADLKSRINANQIGDVNAVNDDIFGILALVAAEERVPLEVVDSLVTHRNSDGGWGIYVGQSSSTDMTALAVIALKAMNYQDQSVIDEAIQFIRGKQNTDGGFPALSGESTIGSTAWVDWMIVSLGLPYTEWTQSGRTSRDYLWATQQSNGSWSQSVLLTSYALIALAQKGFPYQGEKATPRPTATPSVAPTLVPTPQPTVIATPVVRPTPASSPSPEVAPVVSESVTSTLVSTPSPTPTPAATSAVPPAQPVIPPVPVVKRSVRVALRPTVAPSIAPSAAPSPSSSPTVFVAPAAVSTATPQAAPSFVPEQVRSAVGRDPYAFHLSFGIGLVTVNAVTTTGELIRRARRRLR